MRLKKLDYPQIDGMNVDSSCLPFATSLYLKQSFRSIGQRFDKMLAEHGFVTTMGSSAPRARNWGNKGKHFADVQREIMQALGFDYHKAPRWKAHNLPSRCIVHVKGHAVYFENGVLHDTFDSTRKHVRGYWIRKPVKQAIQAFDLLPGQVVTTS